MNHNNLVISTIIFGERYKIIRYFVNITKTVFCIATNLEYRIEHSQIPFVTTIRVKLVRDSSFTEKVIVSFLEFTI